MWPADTLTTVVGDPEQREDCTNFSWTLHPWKLLDSKKKCCFQSLSNLLCLDRIIITYSLEIRI